MTIIQVFVLYQFGIFDPIFKSGSIHVYRRMWRHLATIIYYSSSRFSIPVVPGGELTDQFLLIYLSHLPVFIIYYNNV